MLTPLKAHNLRCNVSWCPTPEVKVLLLVAICSKTEIYDDRLQRISSEHDVLRLEISVHDPFFVHMSESIQKSCHYCLDFCLGKAPFVVFDNLKQSLASKKLENDINWVLRFKDSFKFQYIFLRDFIELSKNG